MCVRCSHFVHLGQEATKSAYGRASNALGCATRGMDTEYTCGGDRSPRRLDVKGKLHFAGRATRPVPRRGRSKQNRWRCRGASSQSHGRLPSSSAGPPSRPRNLLVTAEQHGCGGKGAGCERSDLRRPIGAGMEVSKGLVLLVEGGEQVEFAHSNNREARGGRRRRGRGRGGKRGIEEEE